MGVLIAAVVFLQVGAAFSDAIVDGTEVSATRMEIDLSVSAEPGGSVVAHLIEPGGTQQTVALRERSSGRYGAIIEVAQVDFVVVFEALQGEGAQSEPLRLTDIGLDRALLGALPVAPSSGTSNEVSEQTSRWGWLALGLGALSLALLAVWALPDRDEPEPDTESEPAGEEEPEPLT